MRFLAVMLLVTWIQPAPANGEWRQYRVTIEKVVDGDTVRVRAPYYWPKFIRSLLVRIRGVDTPEKGKRAKCRREATYAFTASTAVKRRFPKGSRVYLRLWFKNGKYQPDKYWRLLGDIRKIPELGDPPEQWLSEFLLNRGLAVEYSGGTKVNPWCNT